MILVVGASSLWEALRVFHDLWEGDGGGVV